MQHYNQTMPAQGFEICSHTCIHQLAQSGRRQGQYRDCYVYPKNGSACKRHAKNANMHSSCDNECPAFTGPKTRDLKDEDWVRWAKAVAQIYPKLFDDIPLQFHHLAVSDSKERHKCGRIGEERGRGEGATSRGKIPTSRGDSDNGGSYPPAILRKRRIVYVL
ncbi:hypothetical protein JOM56_007696 [Amanita muscaria]